MQLRFLGGSRETLLMPGCDWNGGGEPRECFLSRVGGNVLRGDRPARLAGFLLLLSPLANNLGRDLHSSSEEEGMSVAYGRD